ncbi:ABC transporter ATP-binding protein [Kineosporia sp. NBRC 101731]|uniref:ABC transporter ATP-binding protein n=1 Tax=Kineosporia sp. NBRC 101731 TaxID=3032199 RepID=UPI0024A58109|nr:ABC transporter ATP-binding protein [Kineosporia sp. NBRC 101731]GLY29935.1 ABC transporter ATP-binding protein [Kineosporia sp. NBRC 101731]
MTAALQGIDLVKAYGHGQTAVRALNGVSVTFRASEFTAIMGPSGSGKSTLMHCLAGLDAVTDGRVLVGDTDITRLSDRALTRLRRDRIGFVFQSFNLLPQLSAAKNITLPLRLAGRTPDPRLLDHLVGSLGLSERLRHLPSELSGGQQQRVSIARALISEPQVVFADEPTGNLDSRSSKEVLALLRGITADLGPTVVMVTHDPRAAEHADRVIELSDGQVVA